MPYCHEKAYSVLFCNHHENNHNLLISVFKPDLTRPFLQSPFLGAGNLLKWLVGETAYESIGSSMLVFSSFLWQNEMMS